MALEIIGHRGASGDAPENTLAAVRLAWQQLADAVEIDVRLTGDGQIVSFHDASTKRITGSDCLIAEHTLAELQQLDAGRWKSEQWTGERIPTLEDVVATVPAGKRLYVEIKSGVEIVPKMAEILVKPPASERIVLISFEFEVLAELKQMFPAVLTYQVIKLVEQPQHRFETSPTLAERIEPARTAGFDGFDIGMTNLLTPGTARALLAQGFLLCTWTINDPVEARRLEDMGVRAITTDYPGRMRDDLARLQDSI